MGSQTIESRALKEVLVWLSAITAGYATFLFFEPLYDKARAAVARAGLTEILALDGSHGTDEARFIPAQILNLRGTFKPTASNARNAAGVAPRRVTLNANGYGHFHAVAVINGQEVEFMTDTGATYVALTYETAMRLGIAPSSLKFTGRSTTANGVARVASVVLDAITIDSITVHDVQAVIAEPGRMSQNLLGMSFISKLSGFDLTRDRLVMTQ